MCYIFGFVNPYLHLYFYFYLHIICKRLAGQVRWLVMSWFCMWGAYVQVSYFYVGVDLGLSWNKHRSSPNARLFVCIPPNHGLNCPDCRPYSFQSCHGPHLCLIDQGGWPGKVDPRGDNESNWWKLRWGRKEFANHLRAWLLLNWLSQLLEELGPWGQFWNGVWIATATATAIAVPCPVCLHGQIQRTWECYENWALERVSNLPTVTQLKKQRSKDWHVLA